jgi:hypothetical protein
MPAKKDLRGGSSAELDKLEKEIAHLNQVQDKILLQKEALVKEKEALVKENGLLKKSLEVAYEKIKKADVPVQAPGSGEAATAGYVEIGIIPTNGTIYPISTKVDGIIVPRSIDENKVAHEFIPVGRAIRMFSDGSAFKRALLGPVDKIEGDTLKGVYTHHVVYNRHKIGKNAAGEVCFIEVTVEESKPKVE